MPDLRLQTPTRRGPNRTQPRQGWDHHKWRWNCGATNHDPRTGGGMGPGTGVQCAHTAARGIAPHPARAGMPVPATWAGSPARGHPGPRPDGSTAFTFELRFSENVKMNFKTMRDHVLDVTGGTVTKDRRLEQGSNVRREIHVQTGVNGDFTVALPETTDCNGDGAVCTQHGWMLSNRNELTPSGTGG